MAKRKNTVKVKMVQPQPVPASRDSTPVSNIKVEDTLGGICRLCLTCDGIFTSVIDNRNEAIKTWILNCLSIQIDTNDTLPKTICHRCLFFLEISQEFVEVLSKKLKNPNTTNCFVCTKEPDKNLTLGAPIVSRKLQSCIAQFQMKNQQKNSNRLCKTCYCKLDYLNDLKKKACESKLFFSETEVNTYIQANTKSCTLPIVKNKITKKLLSVKNIVKATRLKINSQIKADTKMFDSISSVVLQDIIKHKNLTPEISYSLSNDKNKRDLKRKAQDSSNGIWQVASSSVPNIEQKRSKRITQKSVLKEEKLSPVMKLKKLKTNDDIKVEKVNKRPVREKKGQTDAVITIDDSSSGENDVSIQPRNARRYASKVVAEKTPVTNINKTTLKRKTVTNIVAPKSNLRENISKKTREPKSQKIKIRMFEAFPSPAKKSKSVDLTPYSCKYCNESFPSTCDGKAHELNNHSKSLKVKLNPVDVNENANINEIIQSTYDDIEKENQTSEEPQPENSIEGKENKISSSIDKELTEPEESCISGELRLSVDDEQDIHDDIDDDNTQGTDIEIVEEKPKNEILAVNNRSRIKIGEDVVEIKDHPAKVDLTITDSQDEEDSNLLEETVTISEQASTKEIKVVVNHTEENNTTVINPLNQTETGEADNSKILQQSTNTENVGNSECHDSKEESKQLVESQNTSFSNSVTDIDETKESKKDSEEEVHDINSGINSDVVSDEQQESPTVVSEENVLESEANGSKNIECEEETPLEEEEKTVSNDVVEEEQIIFDEDVEGDAVKGSETISAELDTVEQQVANEETEVIGTNEFIQEIEVATDANEEQSDNNEGEYSVENQEAAVDNEEAIVDNEEASVDNEEAIDDNEEASIDNEKVSAEHKEASHEIKVSAENKETSPEIEVTADKEDASANNEEASIDNVEVSVENKNLKEKEDVASTSGLKDEDKNETGNVENSGYAAQKNTKKQNGNVSKSSPSKFPDKSLADLIADLEN